MFSALVQFLHRQKAGDENHRIVNANEVYKTKGTVKFTTLYK